MQIENMTSYWRKRFEDAYSSTADEYALRRARCSREDFGDGFMAALLLLKVPITEELVATAKVAQP